MSICIAVLVDFAVIRICIYSLVYIFDSFYSHTVRLVKYTPQCVWNQACSYCQLS